MTINSKLRSSLQSDGGDRCNSVTSQCKCPVCTSHREVKLQSGEWFYRQIQSRFHRPNAALTDNNNTGQDNGAAMDPDSAQIREFIERLVEALVSGQLDDVKVNRLYSHPEYKPVPEEDTPSSVHAALKQRVQRIIQEAMTLPNLKSQNGNSVHKWDDDIKSMTYEDILATAILNKVIERFQQSTLRDTVDGNSNLLSGRAQAMEHTPKFISRVEIGVNGPGSLEDAESSSQDGLRSWSESSHNDPVSMTIEECIEEEVTTYDSAGEEEDRSSDGMVTTAGSELDFYLSGLKLIKQRRVPFPELGVDIVDGGKEEDYDEHSESSHSPQPTDLVSPVDSWEENWLFQRRRLKAGGSSPMPVPMLVPNPSEDFRARIGDRDAEEVSDLSDCSDGALEDIVLAGMTADLQVPQVSVTRADVYSETCQDLPLPTNEETVAYQSTAELHVDASEELIKASSMECLSEFGQQDSEYTEDYESVTQRQMSSLTEQVAPVPRPRNLPVSSHEPEETQPAKLARPQEDVQQDEEPLTAPPRPGTIAEREHRKWESAPPLPNNPYSPENINKRLSQQSTVYSSRSSSAASVDFSEFKAEVAAPLQVVCTSSDPDHRRYGRDYYINLSKVASGERRSSSRVTSPLLEQVRDISNLLDLEQEALHRNIYRNSFRARHSASPHFTVNPLFEGGCEASSTAGDGVDMAPCVETVFISDGVTVNPLFDPEQLDTDATMVKLEHTVPNEMRPIGKHGRESGYSSSLDSLVDPSTHLLRLIPPSRPQMVEHSFESLSSLRRSESLKDKTRKRSTKMQIGGSLRVGRQRKRDSSLW